MQIILSSGQSPPTEFRIWKFGYVDTSKGRFLFDAAAAKSVMAEYKTHGNELAFDYEHRAVDPDARAGDGKAAGWFTLELRNDGLYATNIRWTPPAAKALADKEWRYFSPAFEVEEGTNRILTLTNIALTNLPATRHLTPLMAASRTGKGAAMAAKTRKKTAPKTVELKSQVPVKTDEDVATDDAPEAVAADDAPDAVASDDVEVDEVAAAEEVLKSAKMKRLEELRAQCKKLEEELGDDMVETDDDVAADDTVDADDMDPEDKGVPQGDDKDAASDDDVDEDPIPASKKASRDFSAVFAVAQKITGRKSVAEIIGGLNALSVKASRVAEVQKKSVELAKAARLARVSAAIKDGRLVPALKDEAMGWADSVLDAVLANTKAIRTASTAHRQPEVAAAPSAPSEGGLTVSVDGRPVTLSASEVKAARTLNPDDAKNGFVETARRKLSPVSIRTAGDIG